MYCYADKKGLDGEILKQKECPHCWPWKNPENSDELEANFLLQYFQQKNLKCIKLEGEMLTVECKWKTGSSTITYSLPDLLINYPELKGIDQFLQNRHDKKITYQELAVNNNSDTTENPPGNENKVLLWLGLSGISLTTVGIITWLVLRKRKVKKAAN